MERVAEFRGLPFLRALAFSGARISPSWRSRFLLPFWSRCVKWLDLRGPVQTNLGLCGGFEMEYPEIRHVPQVFGTPADYVTERGALFLTQALGNHTKAFLDVGANIGYFTYFFSTEHPDVPVHYFEPNPECFDIVDRTVKENSLSNAHGHKLALGRERTHAAFYLDRSDSYYSSLDASAVRPENQQRIDVEVDSLEGFLGDHPGLQNLLVKVDVENAEEDFLHGARNVLEKVDFLIVEVLLPAFQRDFIPRLRDAGNYQSYYIQNFQLRPDAESDYRYIPGQYNWLFCRKTPTELRALLRDTRFTVL